MRGSLSDSSTWAQVVDLGEESPIQVGGEFLFEAHWLVNWHLLREVIIIISGAVSGSCKFMDHFVVSLLMHFADSCQLDLVNWGEYGCDENDEGGEEFDLWESFLEDKTVTEESVKNREVADEANEARAAWLISNRGRNGHDKVWQSVKSYQLELLSWVGN